MDGDCHPRSLALRKKEKELEAFPRTDEKPLPMMFMASVSMGAEGCGFSKISDPWDRFSPPLRAESFEKTGHIRDDFIDTTPREDETPAEARCGRLEQTRRRTPRRVSRPPGEYETALNGGLRSKLLPEKTIVKSRRGVLPGAWNVGPAQAGGTGMCGFLDVASVLAPRQTTERTAKRAFPERFPEGSSSNPARGA